MKRVSTVLFGTLALLLLQGTLLASGDELAGDRVEATTVAADFIPVSDSYWHSPAGNPHPEAAQFTPDARLEIVEERNEYTKVYRDPDDPLKRTAMIGSAPLHYATKDGVWTDIDTTLIPKGGLLAVTKNRFETFLADRLRSGHMVEIKSDGFWLRSGEGLSFLLEAKDGGRQRLAERADGTRARSVGAVAVYAGALGGDLVQRVGRLRVEQHLVLSSAPAALAATPDGSLVLRETVRFAPGLTPFLDDTEVRDSAVTGTLLALKDETGHPVFLLEPPTAYETNALAEAHGADTHVGEYRVTRDGDAIVVEKVFAGDWFLAADRAYPVTLDPTVQTTVRTDNTAFHTGYVYRCGGCTGGEYERVISYGAAEYPSYGDRLVVSTAGSTRQKKAWMSFNVSGLHRYITLVNWVKLDIWLDAITTWPGNHGEVRFNDVNMDVCAYDASTANGGAIYTAIDGGSNYLSSPMGGTCSPQSAGSPYTPVACIAPHWHTLDLCGAATTVLKNNRNANIGYFNVGMELTNEGIDQQLRFQDRQHAYYPRVYVNYNVGCTSGADCNDNISCTDNNCNSGRCEYPINANMCYIASICRNRNFVNPANQCQKCNPGTGAGQSFTAWMNDNALACTDSNSCTHSDHCSAGACLATAYTCNDNKACTTDTCDGDGTCTFTINANRCLIGGTCYNKDQANPSQPCQTCRSDWAAYYQTHWGYDNTRTCSDNDLCTHSDHCSSGSCIATAYSCDDSRTCTQDICNGDSTCTHNILPGTCYITNVCYNDEQTSPFNDCKKCDANLTQVAWVNWSLGQACASDGKTCTTDICSGTGTCLHNINPGTCLIGAVCYNNLDDKPGDKCHECASALSQTAWSNVPNNTVSQACYPCTGGGHNIGICHNGIQWCTNGAWGACGGMQCPITDVCDYLDNDCDGNTDEDYTTLRQACDGGDYDSCVGGTRTCREDGTGVECVNDGAIAFFRFEEGTGAQVSTSSGIVTTSYRTPPRTGTITGANWTSSGYSGSKALIFDGVNDYVDIAHHTTMDLTTALTMEAYIYPTAATGVWRVIGGLYNGGQGGYYMAVNFTQGPGFSAWFGVTCGWKYSNQLPPLNKWTHVAATFDGTNARLFIDGAKVHQSACNGNGGQLGASTSPMHIGGLGAYNPTQAPFAGAIDDFGVYKTALTEAQIKARSRDGDSCDGADNDCDGLVDEAKYPDFNTTNINPTRAGQWVNKFSPCDGTDTDWCIHGTYSCSSDNRSLVCTNESPANIPEICDGLDNDCNLVLPLNEHDDDNDSFMICEGDCDDNSTAFHPAHEETCDGFDNNCDNVLPVAEQDLDADLHLACIPGQLFSNGTRLQWADCDDANPRVHKDYPEVCDSIDNDCDGKVDQADPNYLVPKIDSYSPIGSAAGETGPRTMNVTFYGKNFVPTADANVTSFNFGYGVTVNSVSVPSTQQMVVNITIKVASGGDEDQLYAPHDIQITMGNCVINMPDGFDVYDPAAVPTLTQWGVVALGALLLGLGLVAIRRRRFGHLTV